MNRIKRKKCDGAVQAPGSEGYHTCMLPLNHKGECRCPHGLFVPTHYIKEKRGGSTYEEITDHNPRPETEDE